MKEFKSLLVKETRVSESAINERNSSRLFSNILNVPQSENYTKFIKKRKKCKDDYK